MFDPEFFDAEKPTFEFNGTVTVALCPTLHRAVVSHPESLNEAVGRALRAAVQATQGRIALAAAATLMAAQVLHDAAEKERGVPCSADGEVKSS